MNRLRPGSLTFLAIVNFIAAAGVLFSILGQVIAIVFKTAAGEAGAAAGDDELRSAFAQIPMGFLVASLAYSLVACALLTVSGIGYLRLSPWWGRWCGTVYALVSLTWSVLEFTAFASWTQERGASLGTVVFMVHPLLTLIWLHLVLRDVWRPPRVVVAADDALRERGIAHGARRHLWLNARQSLVQSLRGVSGLFVVFTVLFVGLSAVGILNLPYRLALEKGAEMGLGEAQTRWFTDSAMTWLLKGWYGVGQGPVQGTASAMDYAAWGQHLTRSHPLLLSFDWLLLSVVVPLLAPFASFSLIAGDAQHRGFRFLLLRTDRTSVFFGRFLGAALLVLVTVAVMTAVAGAFTGLTLADVGRTMPGHPAPAAGAVAAWTAWAALALAITALPYLALGLWFSTLIPSPIGGLALVQAAIAALPGLAFAVAAQWAPGWWILALSPFAVQPLLFHPHGLVVLGGVLGCLAWTALFLWLGHRHFLRRDL